MTKQEQFLRELAKLLEAQSLGADFVLDPWDSLAIMQTVVAIDDIYGKVVHGRALQACVTVADVLKIAEG